MKRYATHLVLLTLVDILDHLGHVAGSQVHHIRGIPTSRSSLYAPDRDFECFDGSLLIPFSRVNDDYCDCGDGSDEPGTAACANGSFYCRNTGHKPVYLPSSRVNDGVCDCCDASDEYASGKDCANNCHELGREARLEAQKAAELVKEGSKIRAEMLAKGKQLKAEYQARLVKLRADHAEAEMVKKEKEVLKTRSEERESAALEKYKPVEPERAASEAGGEEEEEEESRESEAEEYFKVLDSDASGTVTIAEIQTRVTFDKDHDGAVSEEEAMYFLNDRREITMQEFVDTAWANVKPFLMLEQGMFKPADQKDQRDEQQSSEEHEKEDDEGAEGEDGAGDEHESEHEEAHVQYDEETQAIVDEANAARERFQEAERATIDLENELRRLESTLGRDFGYDDEFVPLEGQCFEYTDLEYVYTLCFYGRASQRSRSGGSDVILGLWEAWIGPDGDKYSKMMYDKGLTCWNGPARSTVVTLTCGKENKLVSVTEPSRCEYAMEFTTPALCNPSAESGDAHDEL